MPAVAIAILVIGGAMALVFDRLWIDAAKGELTTAAEAAALAAAGRLVDDELLNPEVESPTIVDSARMVGVEAAVGNRVAGSTVELDGRADGDIRFGHLIIDDETGKTQLIESDQFPTTVAVRASRTRAFGNPVARLFNSGPSGAGADVEVIVEATINNRVTGFRAPAGGTVPALPIAILDGTPGSDRKDTWSHQVEQGFGPDNLRFDPVTGAIVEGKDGLPEFALSPLPDNHDEDDVNVHLVDIGTELDDTEVARQVRSGWSVNDLMSFNGELSFLNEMALTGTPKIREGVLDALYEIIGQTRVCLLYDQTTPGPSIGSGDERTTLNIRGFVAVRVMRVDMTDQGPVIIVQPTVLATRTAVVLDPDGTGIHLSEFASPYVYKISLTQ